MTRFDSSNLSRVGAWFGVLYIVSVPPFSKVAGFLDPHLYHTVQCTQSKICTCNSTLNPNTSLSPKAYISWCHITDYYSRLSKMSGFCISLFVPFHLFSLYLCIRSFLYCFLCDYTFFKCTIILSCHPVQNITIWVAKLVERLLARQLSRIQTYPQKYKMDDTL